MSRQRYSIKPEGLVLNDTRYFQPPTGVSAISSCLEAIDKSSSLAKRKNFAGRLEVIDFLEFHIIDQIGGLSLKAHRPADLVPLKQRAERAKRRLEEINVKLFQSLRKKIRNQGYTAGKFRNLISEYVGIYLEQSPEEQKVIGYDDLDVFINGLSLSQTIPDATRDLAPEMVYYQKTPARIIFELVEKAQFSNDDVFLIWVLVWVRQPSW